MKKRIIARVTARTMKEIGLIIQEAQIEGNYQGNGWKPDLKLTLSSLGTRITVRGREIEEKKENV